jgi:hypothetical protein
VARRVRTLCWACDQDGILQCVRCKTGRYCSPACVRRDWPLHKQYCRDGGFCYPMPLTFV